ncbi:MAG: asparagine synthetase B [Gemmatales bacterium]|nr:MAG: asparagine synthetase B [Gemmatales bacterium]
MCGIAGLFNLTNEMPPPIGVLEAMAGALYHRGPDEDGFLIQPGLGLASRRLSIVGIDNGKQPISNEDRTVHVVFNGELFDHPEEREQLENLGHRFRTGCDTEIIPHIWEEKGEGMFPHLRGQFAFALWDEKEQCLILARDRFGICPLFWTRQKTSSGEWLLFASEIKALFASGLVAPRADERGINHVFTYFALPGPVTCFAGIKTLLPGHYLSIQRGRELASVRDKVYWQIDFPDRGEEEAGDNARRTIDGFEEVFVAAVNRRLRADVPVVSYLSGGVDSSLVVAVACRLRGKPIPTFTIQIRDRDLDETAEANLVADFLGSKPNVVPFGAAETLQIYPRLTEASEMPVIDTSCGALMLLAQQVHYEGYKVALTGEGADEWLAGYPWYKVHRLLGFLDVVPQWKLSTRLRQWLVKRSGVAGSKPELLLRMQDAVGGPNAWLDIYGPMSLNKPRFYSQHMLEKLGDHLPYDDLGLNLERARRWHPLNRSLYLGARVHLPGHLLCSKGDRVAMDNSVETRYPFLDEGVFDFLAKLAPKWKMRGFADKFILRRLAERWLPKAVARRKKWMFRAPFDSFHADNLPPFVEQLLSPESLRKTSFFDSDRVRYWRERFRAMRRGSFQRTFVEMGLVGVVATQLWYHLFIDASLADLPGCSWKIAQTAKNISRPGNGRLKVAGELEKVE